MTTRLRGRVDGVVQGVGFRPHAHRLAQELRLAGFVRNDERGVLVEVEGDPPAVQAFRRRLRAEAPPLAVVERVAWERLPAAGEHAFRILPSAAGGVANTGVAADAATCEACVRELFDPADRRHRYAFINCTDCGPRFTIVRGVPYDRARTTMARFTMCAACRAEYEDPADRRHHAQPNACPDCGPRLRWLGPGDGADPLRAAAAALTAGAIVAVKGLGGYHLACRADLPDAVAALRARKHREEKPFALMVRDLPAARRLVALSARDVRLLQSPARPIVVAPRRAHAGVATAVAPGSADLGVMLPYTPLHHLLLADAGGPLVMTSGNRSDEPIAFRDDDALERLAGIADAFLVHDRPIEQRADDSVVRGRIVVRRSRGHVPAPVVLPVAATRPLLAVGAEQKSVFALVKVRRAWLGPHIGDLESWDALLAFRETLAHCERLFDVRPEVVAHDLHPGYRSTQDAQDLDGVELVGVQHHHAHLAACLAEHGVTGPAVGAIYDGTGLGTDGTIWGGEILAGDLRGFARAGHLWPVGLPGGERAVREPWRMACAWCVAAGVEPPARLRAQRLWPAVERLCATAPVTTSMGRLFDAVAALAGVRTHCTYEGQAAAELEALAAGDAEPYPLPVTGALVLDARPTVAAVAADAASGVPAARIAARFHAAVAAATAEAVVRGAAVRGLHIAVLSGGVFQNRRLLEATAAQLAEAGLRVLVPERVPPNDGGLALGQAAVAAAVTC
jgi:hydrogenase maturation protein HypF